MKKIYFILVTVLVLALLAACGGKSAAPAATKKPAAPAATEKSAATQAPVATKEAATATEASAATASPAATEASAATEAPTGDFVTTTDDTEAVQASIPVAWTDVDGSVIDTGNAKFAAIAASTSLTDYYNFTASGAIIAANTGLAGYIQTADVWKDSFTAAPNSCEYGSRIDYSDSKFKGKMDTFTNCSGAGNALFVVSASPIDNPSAYTVTIIVNSPPEESTDTATANLTSILDSFDVIGDLP